MPLELLHKLAGQSLPATVTDPADIDKLRLLRAAGHVAVLLPPVSAHHAFARVLTLTPEGKKALANLTQVEDAPH